MNKRMAMRLYTLAAIASLGCPLLVHADVRYTITGLQPLPDSAASEAHAINANGLIVGDQIDMSPSPSPNIVQPVVWQNGNPSSLPLPAPSGWQGEAYAVNSHGDVAGQIWQGNPSDANFQPALWTGDQIQMLDTMGLAGGGVGGINNQGTAVGSIGNPGPFVSDYAVMWSGGQTTILGNFPAGAQASASAINNAGQIVVNVVYNFNDRSHAFVWSNGSLIPVSTLGGSYAFGDAINDAGEVVGASTTAGDQASYAFLWNNGTTTELASLPTDSSTEALAINNTGVIVGYAYDAQYNPRAVIWSDGQYADLNDLIPADSGWSLVSARDIADDGRIVGVGVLNGQIEGFLLTPVGDGNVPEPASLAFLTLGAGLLLSRRRC